MATDKKGAEEDIDATEVDSTKEVDSSDLNDAAGKPGKKKKTKAAAKPPEDDDDEDDNEKSIVPMVGEALVDFIKSHKLPIEYDPNNDTIVVRRSYNLNSMSMNQIIIENGTDEEIETAKAASKDKGEDFRPTPEELIKINKFTGRKHEAHEVKTFAMKTTDTNHDSSGERLTKKAIDESNPQAEGQPWMEDHSIHSSNKVIGTIYDSATKSDRTGGHYQVQKGFILDLPENQHCIKSLEGGVGTGISIHMRSKRSDYMCDECKGPMFTPDKGHCGHYTGWPKQGSKSGEIYTASINGCARYLETSRVPVGDNARAGVGRQKSISDDPLNNELFQGAGLVGKIEALEAEIATLKSANTNLARMTDEVNEGAATVTKDETDVAKAEAEAKAIADAKAAADAAELTKKAEADAAAAAKDSFTVTLEKSLSAHADTFQKGLVAAMEVVTKQSEMLVSFNKAIEDQKAAHAAEISDVKERFIVLAKAHDSLVARHTELLDSVKALQAVSIKELVEKLSNVRVVGKNIDAEQAKAAEENGMQVYKSVLEQYTGKRA